MKERNLVECNICNARFAYKHHMKGHIASVHEGKKPFECNICKTSFAEKGTLKKHLVSVHKAKHFEKL